jgi:hypothetical protein
MQKGRMAICTFFLQRANPSICRVPHTPILRVGSWVSERQTTKHQRCRLKVRRYTVSGALRLETIFNTRYTG